MRNLTIIILLTSLCCIFAGCGKDDYDIDGQSEKFLTYLKNKYPNDEHEPLNGSTVYRVRFDPVKLEGDAIRSQAVSLTTLVGTLSERDSAQLYAAGSTVLQSGNLVKEVGLRILKMENAKKELKEIGTAISDHGDSLGKWGTTLRDEAKYFEENRDSLARLGTKTGHVATNLSSTAERLRREGVGLLENRVVVDQGDSVWFWYSGYLYNGGSYENSLFTTNIKADADAAEFREGSVDLERAAARIGGGGLIRGLEIGMSGAYAGDSLLLFITSDLAYGGKIWGTVPEGAPVVFKVKIEEIKKNN